MIIVLTTSLCLCVDIYIVSVASLPRISYFASLYDVMQAIWLTPNLIFGATRRERQPVFRGATDLSLLSGVSVLTCVIQR